MESLNAFISRLTEIVWGLPMIILLMGGGIFLTVQLGFFQFRHLPHILKHTFGKMLSKNHAPGTVTPFQATASALASTMGAANIVGVPVAIALGGPGAVFWMWIVALIGMATKYSEVVLGLKYREKNTQGEYVGGPMYYIRKGLGWKKTASFFAFALMIEVAASTMVQANSIATSIEGSFGISPMLTGLMVMVVVAIVIFGGVKVIGRVTEKLIPFMVMIYLIGAVIVLAYNVADIPNAVLLIFQHAITPISAAGGFAGAGVAAAIRWGLARGLYSNEAGMGTAPIVHSAAQNNHPAKQGFWGVFEVFVDTLVVCTTTALVVITSGAWQDVTSDDAANMVTHAFSTVFGETAAGAIISIVLMLFVISTIMVLVYYGDKQAEFLFGTRISNVMKCIYTIAILIGSVGGLQFIWQFLDLILAMVIVPNMIALVFLSKQIRAVTDDYFQPHTQQRKESM
ncbi:sodium:alanine symporter [Lentibacillus kapialis]|uniref:Sodium:alanine symporter n=1 Tax=Lentibacillus kapialis TaxID=340214 RepID=A0A917PW40_9BACI|nr:sodium:alanine symporter family protein [Lentibacillus kapialis]GGJ94662.1 sodium:alanine symporter [Lentibacillus kapialis]